MNQFKLARRNMEYLPFFQHYAILYDGKTCHFTGDGLCSKLTASVRIEDKIEDEWIIEDISYNENILNRINEIVGNKNYNFILNNCEHVARYCFYGESISYQKIFGIGVGFFVSLYGMSRGNVFAFEGMKIFTALGLSDNSSDSILKYLELGGFKR